MPSPPDLLLLDSLRLVPDPTLPARFAALSARERNAFAERVRSLRIGSVLYARLRAHDRLEHVPAALHGTLEAMARQAGVNNLYRYRELGRLLRCFEQAGLDVLVLKGGFLAQTVYRNLAAREMSDIDLMVRPEALETAADLLRADGYTFSAPYRIDDVLRRKCELPTAFKDDVGLVDLHWNVTVPGTPQSIDPAAFWERAVAAEVAGVRVRVPAPEDLLLHLCHHTSYHHTFDFGLRPLCDIAETIHHYSEALSWQDFVHDARERRWARGVYLALRLAASFVDADVPGPALSALRPLDFDEALLATALEQLFVDRDTARRLTPAFTNSVQSAALPERMRGLVREVFLSRSELARRYARAADVPWYSVYYAVRLKDLLLRHGAILDDLARPSSKASVTAQRKNDLLAWLAT